VRKDGRFDLAVDLQGTGERCLGLCHRRRADGRPWQVAPELAIRAFRGSPNLGRDRESAHFERLGISIGDASPILVNRSTDEASLNVLLRGYQLGVLGRWPSKTWPAERYVRLLPRLRADFGPVGNCHGGLSDWRYGGAYRGLAGWPAQPWVLSKLGMFTPPLQRSSACLISMRPCKM